jgi:hypothetical protein
MTKRIKPCATCHCIPCICNDDQHDRVLRIMERALRIQGISRPTSQSAAEIALAHLEHNGYIVTFPTTSTDHA